MTAQDSISVLLDGSSSRSSGHNKMVGSHGISRAWNDIARGSAKPERQSNARESGSLAVLLIDVFACLRRILCPINCIDADHHQSLEKNA